MGKRRKRLTMPKYAKKYAAKRAAIAALRGETPPAPVVEEPVVETPTPKPEPVVEITEPEPEPAVEEVKPEPKKTLPNALNTKAKPKTTTKKTTTRKRTTRTRKTTTKTATKS